MSLWKKASDWFTGINDPLGNGKKTIPHIEETQAETHDRFGSVMKTGDIHINKVTLGDDTREKSEQTQIGDSLESDSVVTQIHQKSQNKISNQLSLDVLDLTRVIDIYAESQAVEAFDAEMGKERKGVFQKITGFFARSFQRMGRDAWIDSKKRACIQDIKKGLKNGAYTEESLREHVVSGDNGIVNNAHLKHEEIETIDTLPNAVQTIVDAWINTVAGSPERTQRTAELKIVIESNYPAITADLSQLEASLLRLERAKITSEVDTIEAKLNILDIGRIEQGNGKRKEGWFVKMTDSIQNSVNGSKLPDWVKQKVIGTIRHPNTAAILTAIITRAGVGMMAGATVAAGFYGGFLLPIFAGSAAGGFFASVRARREMRDRTAQVDRRGAMGLETGNMDVDGESSNSSHQTNTWQHPAMDLYNRVLSAHGHPENMEDALTSGIYYLVKHRVGREQGINMLQYDADKSISRQHVEMIRLMNTVFPGLVASFNDGSLFDNQNQSPEAIKTRELYTQIADLAKTTMQNRGKEESKYALKQGAIFGGTAAVIGGSIGVAVHGLISGGSGHWSVTNTPDTSVSHYPDNLQSNTNIHRGFWYDNGTPAPRFDHTELMIHTDKSGGWNVSHMLSKTASTLHHGSHTVQATDFAGKNIQAVITPIKGGPSFVLGIDAQGNIQIPPSMQSAFNNKTFAWLEVGEVKVETNGDINLNPIATVVGKGSMIFDQITQTTPGQNTKVWIPENTPWTGIPFGVNEYHELKEQKPKKPIGIIPTEKIPDEPEEDKIEPKDRVPTIDDTETQSPPTVSSPVLPIAPEIEIPKEKEKGDREKSQETNETPKGVDDENIYLETENNRLDNLWNDIVKIRQAIEGKKDGTVALSDIAEKNMRETLTQLLTEYHKGRIVWNTKMAELGKITEQLPKKINYQENINNLISQNILATKNGKPMMYNWFGRIIVAIQTNNGGIIPFYRSCYGTGGKKKGGWFPCFGITESDSWLIKGTLTGTSTGHGIQELKTIQDILNSQFDWDSNLDSDFFWNKEHNPLVQAGAIIDDDWIKIEEKKQTTEKPKECGDGLGEAWIANWVQRTTGVSNATIIQSMDSPIPFPASPKPVPTPGDGHPESIDENLDAIQADTMMYEQFDAATRILSKATPLTDDIIKNGWARGYENDPEFILKGYAHQSKMSDILGQVKKYGKKPAIKTINAFYARSGKIWLSNKVNSGMSSNIDGNIAIGTAVRSNDPYANLSRRLYEISGVSPLPDDTTIVLFHELGHQITIRHMIEVKTPQMSSIITEVGELRDDQSVGITPLSSLDFYREQSRQNPNANVQFWEDMAELMGLYLMGRDYVIRYLDDRITTRRSMKANITEGLRDRIMHVLDAAYGHYIR